MKIEFCPDEGRLVKVLYSNFDDVELTKFLRSIKVHHLIVVIDPADPLFWKPNPEYYGENRRYSTKMQSVYDRDSSIYADVSIGFSDKEILPALDIIEIEEVLAIIAAFADSELRVTIFPEHTEFKTKQSEFVLDASGGDNVETINTMVHNIPLLTIIPSLYAIIDNVPFDIPWNWENTPFDSGREDWWLEDREDVRLNWHTGKVYDGYGVKIIS